jgi:hypothetical protein
VDRRSQRPDGNPGLIAYVFKQEGARLTGMVALSDQTADISSGKVDGDKISFAAVFSFGTAPHMGTVQEDEITMTVKSDNQDFPIHELTLKRSK